MQFSPSVLIFILCTRNAVTSTTTTTMTTTEMTNQYQKNLYLKNITQILDDLLMDYDSSQHPNYKNGLPTIIRSNIYIRSMPVSEMDMDISISAYFRQWWRDSRLSFRGPVENLSLNIKTLEKLWKPDTYFHNGKQSYIHMITVPNKLLRISQAGDILYSMRLTVKCHCVMCLRKFPFDRQSCPLLFGSYAYPSKHLNVTNVNITRREGDFSVLQVNFHLERHAGYFLIQVYIPCVLIVTLSFVSFWLNREATADRIGLGVTSVLTFSTISLDSRADLPKVHYATALDWFLIMSFGFIIFTILEFATVHYFTKLGSGEAALEARYREEDAALWDEEDAVELATCSARSSRRRLEESNKICGVNSYLVYNNIEETQYGWNESSGPPAALGSLEVGTVGVTAGGGGEGSSKAVESKTTQTERKSTCFTQFLHCVVSDQSWRRERQRAALVEKSTNSVSRIDKISRVLFPLVFLLLNIGYWILYSNMQDECERKGKQYN